MALCFLTAANLYCSIQCQILCVVATMLTLKIHDFETAHKYLFWSVRLPKLVQKFKSFSCNLVPIFSHSLIYFLPLSLILQRDSFAALCLVLWNVCLNSKNSRFSTGLKDFIVKCFRESWTVLFMKCMNSLLPRRHFL